MFSGKTVVSFTPNALDKDGRSLKMASSFAKWGCNSIVIEAKSSDRVSFKLFDDLKIKIIPDSNAVSIKDEIAISNSENSESIAKKLWRWLKRFGFQPCLDFLAYLQYRFYFRSQYKVKYQTTFRDIEKIDIILLHSYEFYALAKKISQKNNSYIIYDIHDFYPEINKNKHESKLVLNWIKPFQEKIQRKLIEAADLVLTVSDGLSEKINEYFGKSPEIIKNTHDHCLDIKLDEKISLRMKLNIPNESKIIVSVGNCKDGQHVEAAIQAVKRLPKEVHLVFIGAGYEKYFHYLLEPSLKGRLHFLGFIPLNRVVSFIQECDLGLLLYYAYTDNYKFCLPNGFFQMIAGGLPLLFSDELFEISKLNDRFKFGLSIDIYNSPQIIENVLKILNSEQLAFFKKNVVTTKHELSWENEEVKLKNLLTQLLASKYRNEF